jgi:non-specific serine/threonine protein kinase
MPTGDSYTAILSESYPISDGKIPSYLSNFIGRSQDVARVQELIQDDSSHLVTLTGPGGIGKTRLAAKVATEQFDLFEDGVCWVDLGTLSDPEHVQQKVVAALGLTNGGVAQPTEEIMDSLRNLQLLLVLDNCDHLLKSSAKLAKSLLHANPDLRILATSRENLNVVGESSWPVSGLTFPEKISWGIESNFLFEFMGFDAIKLFRDRATYALSVFRLTSTTVTPVIDICQSLEGLPLSIELAAARIRIMGVNQIAEQIDEQIEKSNGHRREEPIQHQSLLAVLDWSHELLTEEEKILLRRLSVFQNAFSLDAAEAVAGDDGTATAKTAKIKREEILESLASLIDKSFVTVERPREERNAYKLPDTVRYYAAEKLADTGETEVIYDAYLDYYHQLAQMAITGFSDPEHSQWVWLLESEHGNLRNALDWALGQAKIDHDNGYKNILLEMTTRLFWFWYAANHVEEGRSWIDQAVSLPGGQSKDTPVAQAMWSAGALSWIVGDLTSARRQFEASFDLLAD